MGEIIIAPITLEQQSITAPVIVEEQTISAPISPSEFVISAPVLVVEQDISAPITLEHQTISAPIHFGLKGESGAQGIPGPPGGVTLQYPAAIPLGGHRMVVLNSEEQAIYADNTNLSHARKVLGMTTGATSAGDMATIQTGGEMTEPSWNWTLDSPIFLAADGLLTQTQPASGLSMVVAFPITQTKIFLNLREPLIKA